MDNNFIESCFLIEEVLFITPRKALAFLENEAILVDIREEYFRNGRTFIVKTTINLPYSVLEKEWEILPSDKLLIFADYVGLNSREAVIFLREKGFQEIAVLIGGVVDWEKDGLPLKINRNEELIGSCACSLRPRKRK
ncbi:MAG: rhodanese-like domain-containing protein [Candidatus Cloacimonetes bacterium]|nr:rhodanese-like domain-containing protein [Candidatus Cloacimonadota bacterium]